MPAYVARRAISGPRAFRQVLSASTVVVRILAGCGGSRTVPSSGDFGLRLLTPRSVWRGWHEIVVAVRGRGDWRCELMGRVVVHVVGYEGCGCRRVCRIRRFSLHLPLRLPRHVQLFVSLLMPVSRKQPRVGQCAVPRSERSGTHRPSIAGPSNAVGMSGAFCYRSRVVCDPHDAVGVRCRGIAGGRRR